MSCSSLELTQLAERIARLESQNRRLRRTFFGMAGCAGLVILAAFCLGNVRGSLAAGGNATTRPAIPTLTAREIRIVDDSGRLRASLGVSPTGDGRLLLIDRGGQASFEAPNDPNRSNIILVR